MWGKIAGKAGSWIGKAKGKVKHIQDEIKNNPEGKVAKRAGIARRLAEGVGEMQEAQANAGPGPSSEHQPGMKLTQSQRRGSSAPVSYVKRGGVKGTGFMKGRPKMERRGS